MLDISGPSDADSVSFLFNAQAQFASRSSQSGEHSCPICRRSTYAPTMQSIIIETMSAGAFAQNTALPAA
jgi:hypothetical protein